MFAGGFKIFDNVVGEAMGSGLVGSLRRWCLGQQVDTLTSSRLDFGIQKLERPLFFFDTVRTIARKPYPASEGMCNVQRLLKTQNPRIAEVNIDDLVDSRFIRKLDESGFFDRIYGNAGR